MVTENESCMLFLGLFLPFIASVTILSMIEEFQDLKKNRALFYRQEVGESNSKRSKQSYFESKVC